MVNFVRNRFPVRLWILPVAVLVIGATWGLAQPAKKVPVDSLFPAKSIAYFSCDGLALHQEAWKKTAAYESLMESGLWDFVEKALTQLKKEAQEKGQDFDQIRKGIELLAARGLSGAIGLTQAEGVPVPVPYSVLVLHDAADIAPFVNEMIKKANPEGIAPLTISGRTVQTVSIPDAPPGSVFGWWTEGGHLVIAIGINAPQTVIAGLESGAPNVTTHPLYKEYRDPKPGFEVHTRAFVDLPLIRSTYENLPLPIPEGKEGLAVKDVIAVLGLDQAGPIVFASGYRDRALWSEYRFDLGSSRQGLLTLMAQESFTLKDLPGIPPECSSFAAASFNPSKAYDSILTIVREMAKLGPKEAVDQVEGTIGAIPSILGFDPKKELLDCLGNVHVAYVDPKHGLFGFGGTVALQVKDAKTLQQTIDMLLDRLKAELGGQVDEKQFKIVTTEKQGRKNTTFQIMGFVNPSFTIDKQWLAFAVSPQGVETFVSRQEGKLPRWSPSAEQQEGLKLLPEKFVSISITDPRVAYEAIIGAVPMLMGAMSQANLALPVSLADLPSAELVGKPLFPNISVSTVDSQGLRTVTRQSSHPIPLLGSINAPVAVGVGAALLLPAVQQARQAARGTQSKNNMKQIMLAIHNYHDVHAQAPRGTVENKNLKPEERLSWLVSLLPYMDQAPTFNRIDQEEGWQGEKNKPTAKVLIPQYVNPARPAPPKPFDFPQSDYAGMAGIGAEELTSGKIGPKSGFFGYNRTTRFVDITDGMSNTIAIMEVNKDQGPWAAGGKGNLRALTKAPYINGPDGIGGFKKGGVLIGLADGSVREVSENTDQKVLEALSTIQGGEAVGEY